MIEITPRLQILALALALGVVAVACGAPDSADTSAAEAPGRQSGPEHSEEVTYEPAYPADVSAEGLTEADVAQHETHAHGDDGEEHDHDESTHAHESDDDGGSPDG